MPHVSTGFVYMRRGSPTVEKMFRHTVEAFMYYDKLRFIPAYKGGRVEEPCFAYGAARANVPVVEFTEYPIMTFDLLKTDSLPSKLQKFNGQCIELNDYIPFVHMFEKKEGENYKAILAWIMSLQKNRDTAEGKAGE